MICESLIVGLHLYTVHLNPGFNNVNPGAYMKCDSVVVGTYYNSIRRQSAYAGMVLPVGPIDFMVGAATGYNQKIVPMVIPSYKFDNGLRLNLILPTEMTGKGGVHISYEWKF